VRIARRFNAGFAGQTVLVPKGRLNLRLIQPSLRDLEAVGPGPGVETPGYSQMSLRD